MKKIDHLIKKNHYKCSICKLKLFTNKTGFMHHLNSHKTLEYGTVQCPRCNSYQIRVGGFKKLKSRIKRIYLCNNCGRTFIRPQELDKYVPKVKKKTKKEKYDIYFEAKQKLIYNLHYKEQMSVIKIAEKIGMPFESLRKRMHRSGIGVQRISRTKCNMCGMMIRNSLLDRHKMTHIRNFSMNISCPKCKSKIIRKNGTQKTKHHGLIQQFICNSCGKSFNDRTIRPKFMTAELCRYVHLLHQAGKTWKDIASLINKQLNASLHWQTIQKWGKVGKHISNFSQG